MLLTTTPGAAEFSIVISAPNPPNALPPCPAGPEDLAYVIFTSGSTGRPKGSGVHHAGLANLCAYYAAMSGLGPDDRHLQIGAPGFDLVVSEIWPALAAGGTPHGERCSELRARLPAAADEGKTLGVLAREVLESQAARRAHAQALHDAVREHREQRASLGAEEEHEADPAAAFAPRS